MDSLKNIVTDVLNGIKKQEPNQIEDEIFLILKKILKKRQLKHIKVSSFRNGILRIGADSTSGLFYLKLKKKEIQDELKKIPKIKDKNIKIFFNLFDRIDR